MTPAEWQLWIDRAPALSKITPDALRENLEGFRLGPPVPGFEWLSRAIQGALLFTVPVLRETENPATGECCVVAIPNATDAKRIYKNLTNKADALLVDLAKHSELLRYSDFPDGAVDQLNSVIEQASEMFAKAAIDCQRLPPRWRDTRMREDRIERATLLSPIFETAFGREPTVNTYPDSDGGPWPDFYQRIVAWVFDDEQIDDRISILKEARRSDLALRVEFAPGQIPEYPL